MSTPHNFTHLVQEGDWCRRCQSNHTVFCYGTLRAPEMLFKIIHDQHNPEASHLHISNGILFDYATRRVKKVDYPAIIRSTGCRVVGTYVTGLTCEDTSLLDGFERREYKRRNIKVVVPGQGVKTTQAYMFLLGEEKLEDTEWNFKRFMLMDLDKWTGKDERYKDWSQGVLENGCSSSKHQERRSVLD